MFLTLLLLTTSINFYPPISKYALIKFSIFEINCTSPIENGQ